MGNVCVYVHSPAESAAGAGQHPESREHQGGRRRLLRVQSARQSRPPQDHLAAQCES